MTYTLNKQKLKEKLEKELNRVCLPDELVNAEKDPNLLIQAIMDDMDDILIRLKILEDDFKIYKGKVDKL